MKKIVGIAVLLMVFATMFVGIAVAETSFGPAPNSGDCDPDGSGFDRTEPCANDGSFGDAVGPAPNSGDGIPDGSGF